MNQLCRSLAKYTNFIARCSWANKSIDRKTIVSTSYYKLIDEILKENIIDEFKNKIQFYFDKNELIEKDTLYYTIKDYNIEFYYKRFHFVVPDIGTYDTIEQLVEYINNKTRFIINNKDLFIDIEKYIDAVNQLKCELYSKNNINIFEIGMFEIIVMDRTILFYENNVVPGHSHENTDFISIDKFKEIDNNEYRNYYLDKLIDFHINSVRDKINENIKIQQQKLIDLDENETELINLKETIRDIRGVNHGE